jgi:hypothetical protein
VERCLIANWKIGLRSRRTALKDSQDGVTNATTAPSILGDHRLLRGYVITHLNELVYNGSLYRPAMSLALDNEQQPACPGRCEQASDTLCWNHQFQSG